MSLNLIILIHQYGSLKSVLEGPIAASFTNEVLEQVVVHFCKGLGLSDSCKVVDAKLEAELLQVLKMKRAVWSLMRTITD